MAHEKIEKGEHVYAHIFRTDLPIQSAMQFLTEDDDPLQVGIFERNAGDTIVPHRHNARTLDLPTVGEFLWIQSGSAEVSVFDEDWNVLKEATVKQGDCIIFLRGGHALKMLESTRILEVKQGPYPGRDKEKVFRDQQ